MKLSKRSLVVFLCLLIAATAFAAGSGESGQKGASGSGAVAVNEWVFPFVTGLTGEYASWFEQGSFGAQYAVKEINAAGGIRGKPIKLEMMDEGPNPTSAIPVVAKALDMNPLMTFGPCTGPNARAAMPIIKKAQILTNVTTCGTGNVTEWVAPNDPWAISFLDYDEGTAQPGPLEWVRLHPNIKKVVQFIYPKHMLYVSYGALQKAALESKGVEVVDIDVTEETTDLAPVAVEALKNNPDGFMFTILSIPAAKLTIELDKRGVKDHSRMMYFGSVDDPNFYEVGKGYIDGAYLWTYYNEYAQNPKWQEVLAAWRKAHPDRPQPTIALWMQYDAITLLAKGIEDLKLTGDKKVRKQEQAKLREWMINVKDFDFIIPGKCDIVGGVKKQPVAFNTFKNNQKVFLKNISLADYK